MFSEKEVRGNVAIIFNAVLQKEKKLFGGTYKM